MRSEAFLSKYSVSEGGAAFAYAQARDRALIAVCFRSMVRSAVIGEALGISNEHVRQLLTSLKKDGLVKWCQNSRGKVWFATAKGRIEVASKIEDARELLGAFSRRLD